MCHKLKISLGTCTDREKLLKKIKVYLNDTKRYYCRQRIEALTEKKCKIGCVLSYI